VIGPSNPYVSIDPIITRPGVCAALEKKRVVAVSPIVAGKAVKGPLGEMIPALAGVPASTLAIARHYGGLLIGLVVESGDETPSAMLPVLATSTIMRTRRDRVDLAEKVLAWADSLA
jgi:LPPG:FO 2-phospho-L-lactate transferase